MNKKYACLPYLKFSDPLPEPHLFFYLAYFRFCNCWISSHGLKQRRPQVKMSPIGKVPTVNSYNTFQKRAQQG